MNFSNKLKDLFYHKDLNKLIKLAFSDDNKKYITSRDRIKKECPILYDLLDTNLELMSPSNDMPKHKINWKRMQFYTFYRDDPEFEFRDNILFFIDNKQSNREMLVLHSCVEDDEKWQCTITQPTNAYTIKMTADTENKSGKYTIKI